MTAAFMRFGGVATALVKLSGAWLGGLPGSLGLVAVVACTLFAAICGSSVATALAMGTILIPAMIVMVAGGRYILAIFGKPYVSAGYGLLIVLALSAMPDAVSNIAIAVFRVAAHWPSYSQTSGMCET